MKKGNWKNIFSPGPRGKLYWAVFGILILFIVTFVIDIIGSNNKLANGLDYGLSQTPIVSDIRMWPKIETSQLDNSKSLKFRSIKDIELANYGFDFKLGLDLLGGTHLIYTADVTQIENDERPEALAGVRDVIERRVNAFGVSEPVVQTNQVGSDWRVIVELAGVSDVNTAINMIGETPLLEFKEENPESTQLTEEQADQLNTENNLIKEKAQGVLDEIIAGANLAELAKEHSDDLGSKDNGGLYQGVTPGTFVPEYDEVIFEKLATGTVYSSLVETQFGYHIVSKESETGIGEARTVDTRHILFKTKTPEDLGINLEPEWIRTE